MVDADYVEATCGKVTPDKHPKTCSAIAGMSHFTHIMKAGALTLGFNAGTPCEVSGPYPLHAARVRGVLDIITRAPYFD